MADPFTDEERLHLRTAYTPEGLSETQRGINDYYNRKAQESNQDIVNQNFDPSRQDAQPLINNVESGLMRSSTALGGDQMYNSALSSALSKKAQSNYARSESDLKRNLEQEAPLKRARRIEQAAGYMSSAEQVRQGEAQRRQQIEDAIHGINMQKQAGRASALKSIIGGVGSIGGAVLGAAAGPGGAMAGAQLGSSLGGLAGGGQSGGSAPLPRMGRQ